jgi:hypothetical protein
MVLADEAVALTEGQASGAGTAGGWLLKIGIGVVASAGWLAAAYTYLTGRPPP